MDYIDQKNFVPQEEVPGGKEGLDKIVGQPGPEVTGTSGDDHMFGGKYTYDGDKTGGQEMRSGDGDDVVEGNTGNDTIHGENGNDLLAGGLDNDLVHGGAGSDKVWDGSGDDTLDGGSGNDTLEGNEGADVLMSGSGQDRLHGGNGDDTYMISAPEGRDVSVTEKEDGGYDRLFVDGSFDMSRDAPNVEEGHLEGSGDHDLIGTDGDDRLTGNTGNNVINGGDGDDRIDSGDGDNTIVGGEGDDVMTGGDGSDRFHFGSGDGNDRIEDFTLGKDMITFHEDVDPDTVGISGNGDGNVVIRYGEAGENGEEDVGKVHLDGVATQDFREAAAGRDEAEDPIIRAASETGDGDDPDPGNAPDPQDGPSLDAPVGDEVPDRNGEVPYDASAFTTEEPGGYRYVSDTSDDEGEPPADEEDEDDPEKGPDQEEDEEDPPSPEEEDDSSGGGGGCFVATAAYGDASHPDVVDLRRFREAVLRRSAPGRAFIALYWRVGPVLARHVSPDGVSGRVSRGLLSGLVSLGRRLSR